MEDIESLKAFYEKYIRNDAKKWTQSGVCENCIMITITYPPGSAGLCCLCSKYYCGGCFGQAFSEWSKMCRGDEICNNCFIKE